MGYLKIERCLLFAETADLQEWVAVSLFESVLFPVSCPAALQSLSMDYTENSITLCITM
jgi:hypothetical protein